MKVYDMILENLEDLGIRFWVKPREGHQPFRLAFKYPEFTDDSGRKELYKFIRDHERKLIEIIRKRGKNKRYWQGKSV